MKLYTYPGAPNSRRVHIYLAEKGIDVPFQTVDIMRRENRQSEFVENVNSLGGLPVLELDDGRVQGSPLTKAVVEKPLPEATEQNRAVVHRTCRFFDAALAERPQFAGDAFSMADILALCSIEFATRLNDLPPDPALANRARWHQRVSSRPSAGA